MEGVVFFCIAELYVAYVLPLLGISNDPVRLPYIDFLTPYNIPLVAVFAYGAMYFGFAGALYWAYYEPPENEYLKRNKVQPDVKVRWSMSQPGATSTDVKMFWKSISTSVKGIASVGFIANWNWYILQGKTRIYFTCTYESIWSAMVWWVVAYILVDISGYLVHRTLHWPWLYVRVHKLHHFWKSPTPFVVSALHPIEILSLTSATMLVCSSLPLWWPSYIALIAWIFFYNTIDHSGVAMSSIWKWQAPVKFHDDHHKYFHVNYGPMVVWWDKMFGSYLYEEEANTTTYNEDTFHNHWQTTPGLTQKAKTGQASPRSDRTQSGSPSGSDDGSS